MPTLRRDTITLRAFEERDVALIQTVASDPLIPLITTIPTSGSVEDGLAFIHRQHERLHNGEGYSFAIADVRTDQAMGQIGLWLRDQGRASIGYWVDPRFRRQGYLTEALQTLTEWALTLDDVDRLELYVEPWNEASWRAAEGGGYQREGLLRSWQRVGRERRDMYLYSRLSTPA